MEVQMVMMAYMVFWVLLFSFEFSKEEKKKKKKS